MALGYEGYVTVKVSGVEDIALCTGASVPESRVRMESSAAYGGKLNDTEMFPPIGTPRIYDWSQSDGSVDFDLTDNFLINQMVPWLQDRQKASTIKLISRKDNVQTYNKCYWKGMSLNAASGGLVTGSIEFAALQRDSYTQGGDYTGNSQGMNQCGGMSRIMPPFLNPSLNANINPVPYWKTQWVFDGANQDFTDWSLNMSQDVVKFFVCEDNDVMQPPKFIAVGPLTLTMNVTYVPLKDTVGAFVVPDEITTAVLNIGSRALTFGKLELNQATDAVASKSSFASISADYSIYEYHRLAL